MAFASSTTWTRRTSIRDRQRPGEGERDHQAQQREHRRLERCRAGCGGNAEPAHRPFAEAAAERQEGEDAREQDDRGDAADRRGVDDVEHSMPPLSGRLGRLR
jgi:hypothetical protein